jgi:hypothetical protein
MELEVFFTNIIKLVISFMNRKFSCGYATHFFHYVFMKIFDTGYNVEILKLMIY